MSKTFSILIVDDHIAMQTTLRDILEDEGYTVVTASSGSEAIERCQKQKLAYIQRQQHSDFLEKPGGTHA